MDFARLKRLEPTMKRRARIMQLIRDFFVARGFLEVETPIMVPVAGQEPHLSPISVQIHQDPSALPRDDRPLSGHLITSPEYACKKLLAAGYEKIFTMTKVFRDGEPWGELHNPEFTMIEWYRTGADYRQIMKDTEELVAYVANIVIASDRRERGDLTIKSNCEIASPPDRGRGSRNDKKSPSFISYQGQSVDISPPWPRLSVRGAFRKYCDLDLNRLLTRAAMATAVDARGYSVYRSDTFDDLFFKIFLTEIEPQLGKSEILNLKSEIRPPQRPVILYDYPAQMAALARKKPGDPRYAERFEAYIGGMELANAFSELTDGREQYSRLKAEQRLRRKLGREAYPIDKDFINAVGRMPPSAGIALGVDRLVMLLLDARTIDEVLLFGAGELFHRPHTDP